jgi:hypothetical protein
MAALSRLLLNINPAGDQGTGEPDRERPVTAAPTTKGFFQRPEPMDGIAVGRTGAARGKGGRQTRRLGHPKPVIERADPSRDPATEAESEPGLDSRRNRRRPNRMREEPGLYPRSGSSGIKRPIDRICHLSVDRVAGEGNHDQPGIEEGGEQVGIGEELAFPDQKSHQSSIGECRPPIRTRCPEQRL